MVPATVEVSVPYLPNPRCIEQSSLPKARFGQQVVCPAPQWPAQPVAERNSEAHFRPLDERLGNVTVQHLTQQPLADTRANFSGSRQTPGKFDDTMIDKRNTKLQWHCHAGSINLGKNVIG